MNKPKTGEQFLDVLAKSGLLPADRVRELADGATAKELADRLTASGHITDYQARHLLAGRAEGYFLGPYKLLDRLGKGKNGQVYLAEHTRMRRRVAVKVLQAETAQSHEGVRRFEREAQAAAALQHPHIVQAFDFGHVGKIHYLVMEYVEGRNLLQMAAEDGRMAPRKAAALMKQAAEALHFAHEAGVVHRDVKPSNLMVSAAGRLTLLDLGLALYHGDDENLTRGGAVLGVAAFIAPEQATDSHAVDGRADVYGLGATFWLMVTGKTPPVYGDFAPPPPRTPAEQADYERLLAVIRKAMAAFVDNRYPSAAALAEALVELVDEPIPDPLPTPTPVSALAFDSSPAGASILDEHDDNDDSILSAPVATKSAARTVAVNRPAAKRVTTYTPPPAPAPPEAVTPGPFHFDDFLPRLRPTPDEQPATHERSSLLTRWWVWAVVLGGAALVGAAAAVLSRFLR